MCILILKRKTEYPNILRSYKVYIDNEHVDKIDSGQTKEIKLNKGKHVIQLKLDKYFSSNKLEFDIDSKESVILYCESSKSIKWLTVLLLCLVVMHFILKYTLGFSLLIYIALPFFLYFIYLLLFNKAKYLNIRKV